MCSIPSSERLRAGFLFSRYGLCLARVHRIPRKSKRRERPAPECAGLIARCVRKSRKTGAKTGQKRRIWPKIRKSDQYTAAQIRGPFRIRRSLSRRVTLSGQVNNGIALRAIKRPLASFSPLSRPVLACRSAPARRRHGTAKCVLAYWRSHSASAGALIRLRGIMSFPPCLLGHPRLEHRPNHAASRVLIWHLRRGGRVVECTALEMRHRCKPIGGSNPSLSARTASKTFRQ